MMNTPIAAYKPKEDQEPKPSNYTIDAIGMSAGEVSDEVGFLCQINLQFYPLYSFLSTFKIPT